MAHLSKRGPWFVARFSYLRKEYKKSLKTKDKEDAEAALHDVESRIHALRRGLRTVPPGIDPGNYIVWGDAAEESRANDRVVPGFDELVETYLEAHQHVKAESTIDGERIHLRNIRKHLGAAGTRPVDQIRHRDLENALLQRHRVVSGATVNKERRTLLTLFGWALRQDYLDASPAASLPVFEADSDGPPFRTVEEIEEILSRGDLDDIEVKDLWECLYLTQEEIGEILSLVKERAGCGFVHPIFMIIAYTGIRRGEMLRLRWLDVDFRRKVLTARSRKQSRQRKETSREIELHPELEAVLLQYRETRPRGKYVICSAEALTPLTKDQANNQFKQPLKGTRWERQMPSGKKKIVIGFHTFRHSFASNLAIQGVDQRIIDKWMGHQTEEMRKRYQHLFPKALSENIRKLSYST